MKRNADGSWEITSIREAQALTTSAFPELIRKGSYEWIRKGWDGFQTTFQNFYNLNSGFTDPEVTYYHRSGMGVVPIQDEGMPAGLMGIGTTQLLTFRVLKRTGMIAITEEMILFDKTQQIKDIAGDFGTAQKRTQEVQAWGLVKTPYSYISDETNIPSVYQSSSSTAKPWVNAGDDAFSGSSLFNTILKMQAQADGNGNLLGVNPDSMACPVIAQPAIALVLDSEWLGFTGSTQATGLNGPGTFNPYRGMIDSNRIFTSPFFTPHEASTAFTATTYPWVLWQQNGGNAWTVNEIHPLEVLNEEPQAAASAYFDTGVIRIRGRIWDGPALKDPRVVFMNGSQYSLAN